MKVVCIKGYEDKILGIDIKKGETYEAKEDAYYGKYYYTIGKHYLSKELFERVGERKISNKLSMSI